jgi:hypothetical protein
MRRVRRRVAGRADIADQVASLQLHAFAQPVGVAVEMGVVVGEARLGIELVDRQAAGNAGEELDELAVVGGEDPRAARRRDVDGLVAMPGPAVVERVAQVRRGDALDRDGQPAQGRGLGRRCAVGARRGQHARR